MLSITLLKEFSFFKDFSNEQLKKMASLAKEETYQAGTQLYANGDEAYCYGFIFIIKFNTFGKKE